jgi:hypothetical protein
MAYITHKVSEGATYVDPKFAAFAGRARAHNGRVLLGGYCVNRRGDQRPQVDHYIRCLDASAPWWRDGNWVVQLDCERWSNKDGVYAYEPRLAEIREWCSYFMARTGSRWKPIVYAPKWTYGDALAGLEYPLWASAYGTNPTVPYRQAYPGDQSSRWAAYSGQTPAILQYGSRTTIGSQGTCDANAYRGTLAELVALTRGPAATAAFSTTQEDEMYWFANADREYPGKGLFWFGDAMSKRLVTAAEKTNLYYVAYEPAVVPSRGGIHRDNVLPLGNPIVRGNCDGMGPVVAGPVAPPAITHEQLVAALSDPTTAKAIAAAVGTREAAADRARADVLDA